MTIDEQMEEFAYKTVVNWEPGDEIKNPAENAYRISITYDESDETTWPDKFAEFLETEGADDVEAILVGSWGSMGEGDSSADIVDALVTAAEQLKKLTGIFVADVTYEECECSWITQTDLSPILAAYPNLKHFGARGGQDLRLGKLHHQNLETLIIETGGLDQLVVQEVASAQLPNLKHLELWLGDTGYGATWESDDLKPILSGNSFPKLEYLGLKNSEAQDDVAKMVAASPLLARIKVLDLSMGTISDEGVEALLSNDAIKKLKKLDIHHNFCSNEMIDRITNLGIDVDVSDCEGDETEDRYVVVGE